LYADDVGPAESSSRAPEIAGLMAASSGSRGDSRPFLVGRPALDPLMMPVVSDWSEAERFPIANPLPYLEVIRMPDRDRCRAARACRPRAAPAISYFVAVPMIFAFRPGRG